MGPHSKQEPCKSESDEIIKERKNKNIKKRTKEKHRCSLCLKPFERKGNLISHRWQVHKIKKKTHILHSCSFCDRSYYYKYKLKSHEAVVGGKCDFCSEHFALRCALNKHFTNTRHNRMCPICMKFFQNPNRLNRHVKRKHSSLETITCQICDRDIKGRERYNDHMKYHQDSQVCNVCGKTFLGKNIKNHICLDNKKEEPCRCKICGQACRGRRELDSHTMRHKSSVSCDICKKEFLTHEALRKHVLDHAGKMEFSKCSTCGKLLNSTYLRRHIRRFHHKGRRTKHECEKCKKQFKWHSHLKMHIEANCASNMFKCEVNDCNESFRSEVLLSNHHMFVHAPETIPTCDECGKQFRNRSLLKHHIAVKHCGEIEKRFKCTICEKSYTAPASLARHMRNHTGERPYKCTVCDATFTQDVVLINHMRIHSGEKNHQCDQCGMRFGTKFFMLQHAKKHEREKQREDEKRKDARKKHNT